MSVREINEHYRQLVMESHQHNRDGPVEVEVITEQQPSKGAGWVPWLILWLWCFSLVYYGLAQGRERSLPENSGGPEVQGR